MCDGEDGSYGNPCDERGDSCQYEVGVDEVARGISQFDPVQRGDSVCGPPEGEGPGAGGEGKADEGRQQSEDRRKY